MARGYSMSKPRGPRGPYKKSKVSKKSWTPRRKLLPTTPIKNNSKISCSPRDPLKSQSKAIVTPFGTAATAITLAISKLMLKPKHHAQKIAGRRLNFKVISYQEIVDYITQHPAACKIPSDYNLDQAIPSRATFYRIISHMGFDRDTRTRSRTYYKRFFAKLQK